MPPGPGQAAGVTGGAVWGRGLGEWWPLVRSSGMEWGPHLHRTRVNSRAQWRQTLGGHLHLGDGFISHSWLVCSQKGELRGAWGPPGLGKSWPPSSCLQRPCQGPPQVCTPSPALLQPRLPPMGYGLARGWVRFACCPHPESNEDELAAHHPCHVEQEEGVVGDLGPAPP